MTTPAPRVLDTDQAHDRIDTLTVIDVRTPGEYAAGHLPGAHNIPLDQIRRALPALKEAAERADLLIVCASGARSGNAAKTLTTHGIPAATLTGGTTAWAQRNHQLHHPAACDLPTTVWGMERQVRLTAGTLVLIGLALGLLHPAFHLISAAIAGGLVASALTNTCGMAAILAKFPHNRPRMTDLNSTLDALRNA
ncbi:rhodanese-like domain-containing protein [Streptomyces sp. NBC_01237]|uniref:rhodanese-like domain-containing protein n=1 Tax=Streptomyces sp. NBC_01237 TaxID=2903790 RepID=UPI002DD9958D|nr:rhodanese-like domain-containing protein [Streptomyces sp. NBC_01237]WRZ70233.1 rhodanese-like domain-containing protein [Streptomyces sp. NBC_01237]